MHGGYETVEERDVRIIGGGRGLCGGGRKKSGWGVFWTTSELAASTPTSGRLQPRKRGIDAKRFHGEMDRCRESHRWITACSVMPECDRKEH